MPMLPKVDELMTVREFRAVFSRLRRPVKVIRSRGKVEILGTWIPEDHTQGGAASTPVRYPPDEPHIESPERTGSSAR